MGLSKNSTFLSFLFFAFFCIFFASYSYSQNVDVKLTEDVKEQIEPGETQSLVFDFIATGLDEEFFAGNIYFFDDEENGEQNIDEFRISSNCDFFDGNYAYISDGDTATDRANGSYKSKIILKSDPINPKFDSVYTNDECSIQFTVGGVGSSFGTSVNERVTIDKSVNIETDSFVILSEEPLGFTNLQIDIKKDVEEEIQSGKTQNLILDLNLESFPTDLDLKNLKDVEFVDENGNEFIVSSNCDFFDGKKANISDVMLENGNYKATLSIRSIPITGPAKIISSCKITFDVKKINYSVLSPRLLLQPLPAGNLYFRYSIEISKKPFINTNPFSLLNDSPKQTSDPDANKIIFGGLVADCDFVPGIEVIYNDKGEVVEHRRLGGCSQYELFSMIQGIINFLITLGIPSVIKKFIIPCIIENNSY